MIEFEGFPKMARLFREIIVTEKLDGTNAQIQITEDGQFLVGSRTRYITPENDNYGFAKWAYSHKDELLQLGVGRHFGEWWGAGIQRGYGLEKGDKRFSLFNTIRWTTSEPQLIRVDHEGVEHWQQKVPECCGVVPELYRGAFSTTIIKEILEELAQGGSKAVEGYMKPEGIITYHTAGNVGFKTTLEKDELRKGQW